jgi:RHS repeat-associated protein
LIELKKLKPVQNLNNEVLLKNIQNPGGITTPPFAAGLVGGKGLSEQTPRSVALSDSPTPPTSHNYCSPGQLASIQNPDGITSSYDYDGFLPLKETWTGTVSGNITRAFNNDFQLFSVAVSGGSTVPYTYDSDGLLTNVDGLTLARNASNGLLAGSTLGSVTDTYTYNSFGEVSNYTAAYPLGLSYDVLGNLRTVLLPDGNKIDYVIDGRNRRVGKKVGGSIERQWIYDGQLRPAAELDGTGALISQFVYATHINVPDYMVKGGVTYRIITDHLGSLRFVIDVATGTIAQRMDYDDWGNVLVNTNPDFTPFGFAGGMYDSQTKLVRFGARDYDSEIGRWTAKDPIGFGGGHNFYAYALSSPLRFKDPYGLYDGNSVDFSKCEGKGCVARCICRLRVGHEWWESTHWGLIPIEALEFGAGIGGGIGGVFFIYSGGAAWPAIPVGLLVGGALGAGYGMLFEPVAKAGFRNDFINCLADCNCPSEDLKQDIFINIWCE